MIVKICGLTRDVDIAPAVAAGATHLGIIFAPASPRVVPVDEATILRRVIPAGITAVGVFKDQGVDEVLHITKTVGLTWVQLHGGFSAEAIALLQAEGLRVIWATPVSPEGQYEALPPNADLLLLDTAAKGQFGGTGEAFAWANTIPPEQPFLVAGGIGPRNARRALDAIACAGIDLSSSVEAAPGVKSHALLRALGTTLHPMVQPVDLDAALAAESNPEVSS